MTVTIAQLATHAAELIRLHKITWQQSAAGFSAYPAKRTIVTPPIQTEQDYARVLHEAGHVETPDACTRGKDFDVDLPFQGPSHINTAGESAAWGWARTHAAIWTARMEQEKNLCLSTYREWAALGLDDKIWVELTRVRGRLPLGHALFQQRRQEMQHRIQLCDSIIRDVTHARENSPLRQLERQLDRLVNAGK